MSYLDPKLKDHIANALLEYSWNHPELFSVRCHLVDGDFDILIQDTDNTIHVVDMEPAVDVYEDMTPIESAFK